MQTLQLFLNGQAVDLSDNDPVALTFQINSLAEVKNQQGNTSNQFKLPLTQLNRRILGFPDDIRITNNLPYTQYEAKIVQDGLEIVPNGTATLNSSDENSAAITVLSGNVDFFDQIDGKIYDMGDKTKPLGASQPFLPYQHTWDLNTAVDSRNNTEGFIYPVIDHGSLSPLKPYTVDVRNLRPAFFLKTAINLIIKQTGYKATGRLLSDELYNKIIIPFSNDEFEHGTDYQTQPDNLGLVAYTNTDQSKTQNYFAPPQTGLFNFGDEQSDPNNQFNGTYFTAKQVFTCEVLVTIPKFYYMGKINDTNPTLIDIIIRYEAEGGGTLDAVLTYDHYDGNWIRVPGTSGGGLLGYMTYGQKKLSTELDMQIGDQISVAWAFRGDAPGNFTLYNGASITIKSKNENVLFGQQVQCERIFPDITQKDLLKDTLQRFAIICQTDNSNRVINFASFKDIIKNIPIARDWTAKCLNQGKSVVFQLGDYAQVNNLKYKTDDAITDGYADDVININDKTLQASVDLFTSQFAPSYNTSFAGGYTAQIRRIPEDAEEGDNTFSTGVSPRILVDNKLNLFNTGSTVNFTDGASNRAVNDVISTPYFYKQNGQFNLMWKDQDGSPGLRSLYYAELEKILKQTKKVTRYFLLTPRDILELDLLIPIYLEQDNAYYYITQVFQWRKGIATKVELVKVGEIN